MERRFGEYWEPLGEQNLASPAVLREACQQGYVHPRWPKQQYQNTRFGCRCSKTGTMRRKHLGMILLREDWGGEREVQGWWKGVSRNGERNNRDTNLVSVAVWECLMGSPVPDHHSWSRTRNQARCSDHITPASPASVIRGTKMGERRDTLLASKQTPG